MREIVSSRNNGIFPKITVSTDTHLNGWRVKLQFQYCGLTSPCIPTLSSVSSQGDFHTYLISQITFLHSLFYFSDLGLCRHQWSSG